MKIGQTSIIVFLSKLLGSLLGFIGTLYLARELGAGVIGVYALITTVVGWLVLFADLGVGSAMVKRISEGEQQGKYLVAGVVWVLSFAAVLSVAVVLVQPVIESYIGEFDEYVTLSVVWFIIGLLLSRLTYIMILRILRGEHKVHIVGLLDPVNIGGQSLIQIGLVFVGFELFGMLVGAILGSLLAGLAGLVWVSVHPARPAKHHFWRLFNYAKFSWLGKLQSRAFNEVDILLLGVFVQTSLVGVYSVAWSLAKFLDLFGTAIRSTLFPELSYKSAQESKQAAAGLVEDSLAYTGLVATPGFVGGVLLGDRLLALYGEEFADGSAVLGFLILAVLLFSYQKQLMGALNGLDRPDLAFRVNAVFIALNAGLNLVLISQYGIEGAAVASVLSTAVSLALVYYMLSGLITFTFPATQIARQWAAALAMGVVVLAVREGIETANLVNNNAVIVVSLVSLGAGVYFLTLLAISAEFRATVDRNLPADVPLL